MKLRRHHMHITFTVTRKFPNGSVQGHYDPGQGYDPDLLRNFTTGDLEEWERIDQREEQT